MRVTRNEVYACRPSRYTLHPLSKTIPLGEAAC
jgi:hypothetical protein